MIKNKYFYLLILILFAVFWIWWLPGPRVANDFSFISSDWLKLQFDIPRVWNERGSEGLGEYTFFLLVSWPVSFVFGALAHIGMTFEIWERILVLLFIFLGSISIWKFLGIYSLSDKSKFIGSLFYLINTYPILLIDGGQVYIALTYSLFPLVFLSVSESIHANLAKKILAGIFVSVMGFLDIRFIYVLLLPVLIKFLFNIFGYKKEKLISNLRDWIKAGLIIGSIVLGLNASVLVVQFKDPLEGSVFSSFTTISNNFVNLGHAFLVISPHWYQNIFGRISQLKFEFILLPILVLLAPILRRKDKNVLFWLLVAIVSIFLTKGGAEPLSGIYPWLHSYIPGFSFFRDSTKFFFLIALSYSILIAFTSEEILKKISRKKLQIFYLALIAIYLLYLVRPVFLNQMIGAFSIQPNEKDFQTLYNVLQGDSNFGRVFWIPGTAPLSYSDLNHPVVEAIRVFNMKPFAFGVKGSYELFNFLREASYVGEIFDVAGVSYIAYPYLKGENISSDDIQYYYTFLNQLTHLPWIEERVLESKVPLLKTKSHQDKIFITNNTWIVFGSDEIFNEAIKSSKLKLSNNAVIFAEYQPEMGTLISNYPEVKIVLNNKTKLDLLATFFPESTMVFPAQQLSIKPNEVGWWKNDGKDFISWRDFLQSKYNIDSKEFDYGGGWTVGEGERQFTIYNLQFTKGKVLLARVMESSRGGRLKFYQGNQEVGEVSTKVNGDANVRWFEMGRLIGSGELTIVSKGDINVINAIALVNPQELAVYKNEAESLQKQITDFKPENTEVNNSSIKYEKMNTTKYKVIVSNLTYPEFIVFSSTYHPLWKVENQISVPVYGFLNGFRVERDGEYIIEFEPQKNILSGLLISNLVVISLLLFYLTYVKKVIK